MQTIPECILQPEAETPRRPTGQQTAQKVSVVVASKSVQHAAKMGLIPAIL